MTTFNPGDRVCFLDWDIELPAKHKPIMNWEGEVLRVAPAVGGAWPSPERAYVRFESQTTRTSRDVWVRTSCLIPKVEKPRGR